MRSDDLGGLPLRFCFTQLRPIPVLLRDERWGCLSLASYPCFYKHDSPLQFLLCFLHLSSFNLKLLTFNFLFP